MCLQKRKSRSALVMKRLTTHHPIPSLSTPLLRTPASVLHRSSIVPYAYSSPVTINERYLSFSCLLTINVSTRCEWSLLDVLRVGSQRTAVQKVRSCHSEGMFAVTSNVSVPLVVHRASPAMWVKPCCSSCFVPGPVRALNA